MNKKFILILVLIVCAFSVSFADVGEFSSPALEKDLRDNADILTNAQLDEYQKFKDATATWGDGVSMDTNRTNAIVMSLAVKIESFMQNIKIMLLGTFASDKGMNTANAFVTDNKLASTTTSEVDMSGVNVNAISRSRGYVVFRLLLAIWLVLSTMWYCVKIVLDPNFQKIQILYMFLKAILITAIYFMLPYIGEWIIKIMWNLAEFICGEPFGTMSYTTVLTSNVNMTAFHILMTLGAGFSVIGLGPQIAGTGLTGAIGSTLSPLFFGAALGGVMANLGICIAYATWGLELYVAIYVMIFYLPMTLFEGFGYKITTVFKFFILNALEIFIGAILIMMVNKMGEGGLDILSSGDKYGSAVGLMGDLSKFSPKNLSSLKRMFEGAFYTDIVNLICKFLLPPLVLSILMPVTGKIVRSLIDGSGLTESTQDAYGQVKTMAQHVGMGTALGEMKKGQVGSKEIKREDFTREKLLHPFRREKKE